MSIRFKSISVCDGWEGTSQGGYECRIWKDEQFPIQEWSVHPLLINPLSNGYTKGEPLPSPQNVNVQFPELWEWTERAYNKVVFGVEINYSSNVEWLTVTSPDLVGENFSKVNLTSTNMQVAFKNLNQLSEGIHTATIRLKAFWKKTTGKEFIEYSPQNIEVRIEIKNGENPPPDDTPDPTPPNNGDYLGTKNITYNRYTQQLTGDIEIPELNGYGTWDFNPTSFRYLNLVRNSDLSGSIQKNDSTQELSSGNYSATLVVSYLASANWWIPPKKLNIPINLSVIEGNGTDFSVSPDSFAFQSSRLPGAVRSGSATINNPNNISVQVLLKPSFIETAVVENGRLNFSTVNSSTLAVGDYSGEIILVGRNNAGQEATKKVAVSLRVVEQLKSDFYGKPYFFALDGNKVTVNKINASASYIKVSLEMVYQGFGEFHREQQDYVYPYFGNKIEFYPGEEVQDFFIKLSSLGDMPLAEYQYHFAIVNILVMEYDSNDNKLSESRLDNIFFAPGKTPKCFPIFSDFPIRRSFSESKVRLNTDARSNRFANFGIATFNPKMEVYAFNFDRGILSQEKEIATIESIQLIPFPNPKGKLIHLFFETHNLVLEWFSCPADHQRHFDFTHIVNETNGEKYAALETETLILNTGWILREEIELVNALIKSRICFIVIDDKVIKARPMSKKNEMFDTAQNLYSMDLEFNIKQNER